MHLRMNALDYYITIYIRVLRNDGSDIALSLPIFMLLLPKATNDKNRMSLYKLLHMRKKMFFSEANNKVFTMGFVQFFLTVVWRSPILRPEAAVFDSWAGRHRSSECSSRRSAAARDSPPAPLPTRQQILQDLHLLKYTDYDAVPGMSNVKALLCSKMLFVHFLLYMSDHKTYSYNMISRASSRAV